MINFIEFVTYFEKQGIYVFVWVKQIDFLSKHDEQTEDH